MFTQEDKIKVPAELAESLYGKGHTVYVEYTEFHGMTPIATGKAVFHPDGRVETDPKYRKYAGETRVIFGGGGGLTLYYVNDSIPEAIEFQRKEKARIDALIKEQKRESERQDSTPYRCYLDWFIRFQIERELLHQMWDAGDIEGIESLISAAREREEAEWAQKKARQEQRLQDPKYMAACQAMMGQGHWSSLETWLSYVDLTDLNLRYDSGKDLRECNPAYWVARAEMFEGCVTHDMVDALNAEFDAIAAN
jgi:hypothetical protein